MKVPPKNRSAAALTLFGFLVTLLVSPISGNATEIETAWKAYEEQRYADAAVHWKAASESQEGNPNILYNLGCAYAKAGDLGHARLAFERAFALAPWDQDIGMNRNQIAHAIRLQGVESSVRGTTVDGDEAFFWWRLAVRFTGDILGLVLLISIWLLIASMLFRRKRAGLKRDLGMAMVAVTLLTSLTCAAALFARTSLINEIIPAVLLDDDPRLREGPSMLAGERRTKTSLTPGSLLEVLDARDGWTKVRLPDGKDGWLPSETLGVVEAH
jgi:tetratricopeptide (TPR) repeat protein